VKIVIPGGTGQVGTLLARAFHRDGHEVTALGRSPLRAPWRVDHWDPEQLGDWTRWVDGADAVINMAGRSVNCRYTAKNRQEIMHSRVGSTRVVGQAIARAKRPPATWLQASTATIYAHRYDAPNATTKRGFSAAPRPMRPTTWRFSIDVATSWERALDEADVPGTRKIKLRSAVILSPDRGGIFDTILGLVRRGLGGRAGDGKQYVSWIHDEDFVRAVYWLLDRRDMAGSVNLASPNPLPNRDFMAALRRAWGVPIGLPASRWMLEIGAVFMRTETELLLKSRRVVPSRLLRDGFTFSFPSWPEAAGDLCARWRAQHRGRSR
jgi:uncharacterized protein (TIGR01777 family)